MRKDVTRKPLVHTDSALSYAGGEPEIWFLKGRAHVKLAEAEVAQKCFDRAIRFDKSKPEYHRALGALLISQDKLANAKKVFQRVLAVSKQIGSAQLQADSCTGLAKRI